MGSPRTAPGTPPRRSASSSRPPTLGCPQRLAGRRICLADQLVEPVAIVGIDLRVFDRHIQVAVGAPRAATDDPQQVQQTVIQCNRHQDAVGLTCGFCRRGQAHQDAVPGDVDGVAQRAELLWSVRDPYGRPQNAASAPSTVRRALVDEAGVPTTRTSDTPSNRRLSSKETTQGAPGPRLTSVRRPESPPAARAIGSRVCRSSPAR